MEGHTYIQWIVAITANLPVLSYGLLSGWISPLTKILKSSESPTGSALTDNEITWIASVMCLSAVCAAPLYSVLADKYGRKITIFVVIFPQLISWSIKIISSTTTSLIIARIMCGISSGGCFNVIPMYTKEISQDSIRGLLGSLLMLFQNIGIFVMYAMGAYLNYYTVLWIAVVFPVVNLFLIVKAPESPAFLVKHGKIDEAERALSYLRGLDQSHKVIQSEISKMRADEMFYKSLPTISYASIFKDIAWRKSAILAGALMTVACSNGNFVVLTYAAEIITTSGVTFNPDLQTLSFPVVLIIGSFVSMSCVEKFGRRTILCLCLFMVMASLALLASILTLQQYGWQVPGWLAVFAIVISVFGNGAGIMPMPYIIMSETFNFQIRAKLMGTTIMYAWFVSFVQLVTFAPISKLLGMHTMFFLYAGINLFGAIVTLVFVPETRGKTVEQIEKELRGEKSSVESVILNK